MKRLLVVSVVGLCVLAGCSDGDPEPKIAPTDSSSAASSTSLSPSPAGPVEPSLPAEAEGEDAAAAEAFVRHFWAMVNYAQATGDVGSLDGLATPTCAACAGGVDKIRVSYADGGSMVGGEATVTRMRSETFASGPSEGYIVTVVLSTTPQVIKSASGEDETYPGGTARIQMIIERRDGKWLTARMDPL